MHQLRHFYKKRARCSLGLLLIHKKNWGLVICWTKPNKDTIWKCDGDNKQQINIWDIHPYMNIMKADYFLSNEKRAECDSWQCSVIAVQQILTVKSWWLINISLSLNMEIIYKKFLNKPTWPNSVMRSDPACKHILTRRGRNAAQVLLITLMNDLLCSLQMFHWVMTVEQLN